MVTEENERNSIMNSFYETEMPDIEVKRDRRDIK